MVVGGGAGGIAGTNPTCDYVCVELIEISDFQTSSSSESCKHTAGFGRSWTSVARLLG